MDLLLIKSKDVLGLLDITSIPSEAQASLRDPIDNLMLQLALCDKFDEPCSRRHLNALFEREGLSEVSSKDAAAIFAQNVCQKIISGEIGPLTGADLISSVAVRIVDKDFHLLDPFIYASSEAESRPEDRAFFEEAIIREAKELVVQLQHR